MILGLDNGYHLTKSSKGIVFPSTIKHGKDIDINTDTIEVSIDGKDYIVGADNGQYVADNNKINSIVTKICTLTSIAKSFPNEEFIECRLVAGLPVAYYSKQKEAFRDSLLNYGITNIKFKDKEQHLIIKDCKIYPQSAGVVFLNADTCKNNKTLIIDIGGGTVDISYFEGLKLVDSATYPLGMLVFFSNLVQKINAKYECNLDMYELDNILFEKKYITIDGCRTMLNVGEDIKSHTNEIISRIVRQFKYKTCDNIFIIGGGGIRLYDQLHDFFKAAVLCKNPQFTNANAFALMGQMAFNS